MYADLRKTFMQDSSVMSVRSALEARNISLCRDVSKFVLFATEENNVLTVSNGMDNY